MALEASSGYWTATRKAGWLFVTLVVGVIFGLKTLMSLRPKAVLDDFAQEWASARNHFAGLPVYMDLHASLQRHLGRPIGRGMIRYNAHPPTCVLLALPFARLPYYQAYLAWSLFSLALLPLALWLALGRWGLRCSPWAMLPAITLILASNSFAQQMNQGQINLVLLALLAGAFASDCQKRWLLAGALVGFAAAIKLFPGFLLLHFLAQRRWTAVISGTLAFAAATLATGSILGWESYSDYVLQVLPRVSDFRDWWPNASLAGFWSKLFDAQSGQTEPLARWPVVAHLGWLLSSLGVAAAIAWKAAAARSEEQSQVAFAATVIGMLLVSPITWDHYFLLLTISFSVLWAYIPPTKRHHLALAGLAIVLGLLRPFPLWRSLVYGDQTFAWAPGIELPVASPLCTATIISYQFYGLVALLIFALAIVPSRSLVSESPALER